MTVEERDATIRSIIEKHRNNKKLLWTELEVALRNEAILYEMGCGKSYSEMMFDLAERWNCSRQSVENYIRAAKDMIMKANQETIEQFRHKMVEKLERLARNAEQAGDRKSMLAAYDQINKLKGAYTQVQKVDADIKGEIHFEFGE